MQSENEFGEGQVLSSRRLWLVPVLSLYGVVVIHRYVRLILLLILFTEQAVFIRRSQEILILQRQQHYQKASSDVY